MKQKDIFYLKKWFQITLIVDSYLYVVVKELYNIIKNEKPHLLDFDSYENVIIAYPIWWGIAAYPVSSFVMGNTFDNKNIYPVCASVSSGLGDSAKNLKSISSGGTWHEGYRFSESATSSDIDIWLKTISK